MLYREVKSEFIKSLIKGTSWNNKGRRKYINELIALERCILDGPRGFASAMRYHSLKRKYRKEWEAIYRELKPEEFERLMQREREEERKRRQEEERRRRKEQEKMERLKREWLEMGGGE